MSGYNTTEQVACPTAVNTYTGEAVVTIAAPIEQVYAYLADLRRHPEWVKNVRNVEQVTPGPIGVGTRFRTSEGPPPVGAARQARMMVQFLLGVLGGAKTYSEARITALEPPYRIAWEAGVPQGKGFFNRAAWELVLAPCAEGTALTQRFTWQPQNATAERMVGAAGPAGLEQAVAVSLAALKRRLEVGEVAPAAPPP